MLYWAKKLRDLDFRQLMDVYEEGNLENGNDRWPEEPAGQQLLMAEQAFYQYLKECFFPTEGAVYAVWVAEGRYVSALRLEPYQDGLLLEALETAPDQRKKGYAEALIKGVLREMGDRKIYSHVGKRNTASLKTHEKCGFHRILEHAAYADGSVLPNACTFCSRA